MNLRQWARATHKKIIDQPAELHHKEFSAADVEMILRHSIDVLVEALDGGDDLRLHDLGRLWVECRPQISVFSNLPGQKKQYDLEERRSLRFQMSAKLTRIIRSSSTIGNNRTRDICKD